MRRSFRAVVIAAVFAVAAVPASPEASAVVPIAVPAAMTEMFRSDMTSLQWHLAAIRASRAWEVTRGEGVTVAVIDSGIDPGHPDFAGRLLPGAWVSYDDSLQQMTVSHLAAREMWDHVGHGTHVASLVAGNADGRGVTGVAPRARLIPVGLDLDSVDDEAQFDEMLSAAVEFAVDAGADVINMSLGSFTSVGCDAVQSAVISDVVVVVAAGNSGGASNPRSFPAGCPGSLSVSATNADGFLASWSSFDSTVSVAAPGEDLLSAVPRVLDAIPTGGYQKMSGTSMAAPVVAGVAALVRSAHPAWSAVETVDAIKAATADVGPNGWDPEYGAGIVDAFAAVSSSPAEVTAVAQLSVQLGPDLSGAGFAQVLSWRPVHQGLTTGYSLRRFSTSRTWRAVLAGDQVRVNLPDVHNGEWFQLIAHTSNGPVASFPVQFVAPANDSIPAPSDVTIVRLSDESVQVKWKQPPGVSMGSVLLYDAVSGELLSSLDAIGFGPQQVVFPRRADFSARPLQATVQAFLTDLWGVQSSALSPLLAPRNLLRVDRLLAAGPTGAAVIGSTVDDLGSSSVSPRCSFPCAGRRVSVYGSGGKKIGSSIVLSDGSFQVLVSRPKHARLLQLTVRLDSFPRVNTGAVRSYALLVAS